MASSIFDPEIIAKRKANMVPRGTAQQVQQRAQRLYSRQLEGKTTPVSYTHLTLPTTPYV